MCYNGEGVGCTAHSTCAERALWANDVRRRLQRLRGLAHQGLEIPIDQEPPTGRPEAPARGNRRDFTRTELALHVQTTLSRTAYHGGRLPLGTGGAASEGGRQRRRATGGTGRKCLLFFLYSG